MFLLPVWNIVIILLRCWSIKGGGYGGRKGYMLYGIRAVRLVQKDGWLNGICNEKNIQPKLSAIEPPARFLHFETWISSTQMVCSYMCFLDLLPNDRARLTSLLCTYLIFIQFKRKYGGKNWELKKNLSDIAFWITPALHLCLLDVKGHLLCTCWLLHFPHGNKIWCLIFVLIKSFHYRSMNFWNNSGDLDCSWNMRIYVTSLFFPILFRKSSITIKEKCTVATGPLQMPAFPFK